MHRSGFRIFSRTDPDHIIDAFPETGSRTLLFGRPGCGRANLAENLADALAEQGRMPFCLDADIGGPAFGVPGAVCLARRQGGQWETMALEGICSLDAGRFRLPLVRAVRRLSDMVTGNLILLPPAITRGIAGAELLPAIIEAAGIRTVIAMADGGHPLPYAEELAASGARILRTPGRAGSSGSKNRTVRRTGLWDAYLKQGESLEIDLACVPVTGTPPPLEAAAAWQGRQAALIRGGRTVSMGEVNRLDNGRLLIRVPEDVGEIDRLAVRDAGRSRSGELKTMRTRPPASGPDGPDRTRALSPGSKPVTMGSLTATLMNGVCGDPLLHLRLMNRKRSLLFDLGGGNRLPTRLAHQVSDVFITHAHMDHIAGFIWLLRSRIGESPSCRIYGPPGLAGHILGMINGVLWDRAGNFGPRFIVHEYSGSAVTIFTLAAGQPGKTLMETKAVENGTLLASEGFRVRAVTLDHGTPVLAFKFELKSEPNARKLVYATDLADSPDNRVKLIRFARNAEILICEAAFTRDHLRKAEASGHLTARACGEIARAAGAAQLIPFHFSKRYASRPHRIYHEVELGLANTICASSSLP